MNYKERYIPKENDNLNRLMVVTGVAGCGKDYLLGQLAKQGVLPAGIQVVSFGQQLFELLQGMHPRIRTRDDMRELLSQAEVQQGVFSLVDGLIAMQPAILNTHVVYRQDKSLTMNPDFDRRLSAGHYLYVWSYPEQIAQWRASDASRARHQEEVHEIALHQDIAFEVVGAMARHFGSSFTSVWNRDNNVEESLDLMQQRINELII